MPLIYSHYVSGDVSLDFHNYVRALIHVTILTIIVSFGTWVMRIHKESKVLKKEHDLLEKKYDTLKKANKKVADEVEKDEKF